MRASTTPTRSDVALWIGLPVLALLVECAAVAIIIALVLVPWLCMAGLIAACVAEIYRQRRTIAEALSWAMRFLFSGWRRE
jgi:hypothetical protein